jgi:hypothetical protein
MDIHHHPWPLQPAEVSIEANTVASAAGFDVPPEPAVVQYAESIDIAAWRPRRLT